MGMRAGRSRFARGSHVEGWSRDGRGARLVLPIGGRGSVTHMGRKEKAGLIRI